MRTQFEIELESLINRHSRENESNTPDFILADYIRQSVEAYEVTVKARDKWYGISPSPGYVEGSEVVRVND